MSNPRPLRIACLHGFRQNANRFRRKTGALRKALERPPSSSSASASPLAELVYLDAPFLMQSMPNIEPPLNSANSSENKVEEPKLPRLIFSPGDTTIGARDSNDPDVTQRSWWAAQASKYYGWEQSFDYLRDVFAEQVMNPSYP